MDVKTRIKICLLLEKQKKIKDAGEGTEKQDTKNQKSDSTGSR